MDKVLRFKNLKIKTLAIITEGNIDFIRGEDIREGAHIPCTGVGISGKENLLALRDALLEAVPLPEGSAKAPLLEELASRRKDFTDSLEERDKLLDLLAKEKTHHSTERGLRLTLEKEKETWNKQILTMQGNHDIAINELQLEMNELFKSNQEFSEQVDRIRKSRNKAHEELASQKIVFENDSIEMRRVMQDLSARLVDAERLIGEQQLVRNR